MDMQVVNKCRTCFNETKGLQSLEMPAIEEPPVKLTYAKLLQDVANINIKEDNNSNLPQHICVCCSRKLKLSHAFIKQAQEVNKHLLGQLNHNPTLGCLEESEIDIQNCLEIKMESDEENDGIHDLQHRTQFIEGVTEIKGVKEIQQINEQNIEDIHHLNDSNDVDALRSTHDSMEFSERDTVDNEVLSPIGFNERSKNDDYYEADNLNDVKKVSASTRHHMIFNKKLTQTDKDTDIAVPCLQCNKIFINSKELSRHLRNAHVPEDRKCACPVCGAKFTRSCNMYKHMRTLHELDSLKMVLPTKEKIHECEKCHRKYTKKKHLNYHIKIKHKDSESSESNPLEPKKSLNNKSEVRPLCFICGGSFSNKGHLIVHMRRHTGEKPFKCDLCDRAYPRISDLTCHRRIHTGEKPYKCKICEKTFRVSTKLATHMRSHTDERPYKCSQCVRSFKYSKDLNIHTRIHTGERPYCCTVCGSTFAQSNSLKAHRMKLGHIENST